jgi:hypothetical protein
MVHPGCRRPPEGSKRGQKRGQRTQQNADDPETPWDTRKVLVFDEDIEDLSRQAAPFEARGFEVHKCTSVEAAMRCLEREVFGRRVTNVAADDRIKNQKTEGRSTSMKKSYR